MKKGSDRYRKKKVENNAKNVEQQDCPYPSLPHSLTPSAMPDDRLCYSLDNTPGIFFFFFLKTLSNFGVPNHAISVQIKRAWILRRRMVFVASWMQFLLCMVAR